MEEFRERVQKLCNTYLKGQDLQEGGTNLVSVDEKTGIQALERKHEDILANKGKTALREYEYIRHGTLSLIASRNISRGTITSNMIRETRNEEDFLEFVQMTVATDPQKKWVIVLDQLNTHMSASLVEWIAKQIGYNEDLGEKDRKGILKSIKSRKAFLEDESHRIRFLFTPKHCSWMNQIELWFNQLQSHVITKGNFTSKDDLQRKLTEYIEYYNNCLAKPYNWKYDGQKICYLLNS